MKELKCHALVVSWASHVQQELGSTSLDLILNVLVPLMSLTCVLANVAVSENVSTS